MHELMNLLAILLHCYECSVSNRRFLFVLHRESIINTATSTYLCIQEAGYTI